jgi:4-amino-4-deoxy-L-arabinose transferase-like glycosyltransferase
VSEHRWSELSEPAPSRTALFVVLAGGALLRFWSLGHDIPFAVAADEPQVMERVVRMMKTGDYNPHFFDYPGLYFHVQLVVACLRFLAGASAGHWTSLDAVSAADFYLWGRAVSALLATATLWLLYRAGLRWGHRVALLATGLMAVVPQHVREAHYVVTDVPLTFFTTLTLWLSLRAAEEPSLGAFAWAGTAVGLAGASKYPGLVAVSMPLVAALAWRADLASRMRAVLVVLGSSAGAFLLAAPYTWLDLPGFLNGFAHLGSHFPARGIAEAGSWWLYLVHLRIGLGWPGAVALAGGVAIAVARSAKGPGRMRWWLLLIFGAAYFGLLSSRERIFGRYLLPLYPVLAILVAVAIVSSAHAVGRLTGRRVWRRAVSAGLGAAVLVPPLVGAIAFDRRISKPSTQSLAYAWFLEQVPEGARVVLEGQALWLPGDRWRVTHVKRLIDRSLDAYREEGYEYLVASSEVHGRIFATPERFRDEYAAYQRLFRQLQPVAMFRETREHPGPDLRVFKLP